MTAVGVYSITVTSPGYDGNTYSDSIALTVLDRAKLDALLQAKWSGMKEALAKGDVEGAVGYFAESLKEVFRNRFTILMPYMSKVLSDMGTVRLVKIRERIAEYDMRVLENGTPYSFQVLFIQDSDGIWWIRSF